MMEEGIPMLSVRDFGAFGDAHSDDTDAIRRAINAAAFTQPIYFPAGIYLVSSGIDISGQNLVGEPAQSALGWPVPDEASTLYGTVIRVSSESNPLSGGVLFSTSPPPDASGKKKAGKRVHLTSLQVDANHRADFGLQLRGASNSVLWQVVARNALLDNFLLDGCQLANFWLLTSLCAGRHGIHLIDCNGATLQNFYSNHSGAAAGPTSPCSSALPNPEACGLLITNELHSGGVYVEHGDIEGGAGSAIYVKDAKGDGIPTVIEKVWIENQALADTVVLDGTRNVIVQNCRIQDGVKDAALSRRAIRLKNAAFSNIIRDNLISVEGESLSGTAMSHGDQIELEAGCFNNHLENNLSLRKVPSNWPSAVPVITRDRNHILGQRQVVSHRDSAPTSGTWEVGDIVFNARPDQLKVAGWICIRETSRAASAIWKAFGRFT
jgi:hypothetical protein